MKKYTLTPEESHIIVQKGTEKPFSGEYDAFFQEGMFVCRQCHLPLFSSKTKFDAGCGWPAFDDTFKNAVKEFIDADGRRTEIQCARCGGHLGHVFRGEEFTASNTRHCVNSLSIQFIPEQVAEKYMKEQKMTLSHIVLGGGCFWCVEAALYRVPGIVKTVVGYAGGTIEFPSYEQVSSGMFGHAEVVRVTFDSNVISLEKVLEYFFQIHNPTTKDRQGNDIGTQYRSIILYVHQKERDRIDESIKKLQQTLTAPIVTEVKKLEMFFPAEEYHQKYFEKNRDSNAYCQIVILPKVRHVESIVDSEQNSDSPNS